MFGAFFHEWGLQPPCVCVILYHFPVLPDAVRLALKGAAHRPTRLQCVKVCVIDGNDIEQLSVIGGVGAVLEIELRTLFPSHW